MANILGAQHEAGRRIDPVGLEIDEVTTDASLSTGTSPPTKNIPS
jgi:hypothetical protein